MEKDGLLSLVADIVCAHVGHNVVAHGDVGRLIEAVHKSLSTLGHEAPVDASAQEVKPAVKVRGSIKDDALICLVCGARQKMLKRHIRTAHELSPSLYRERFGLKADYPMTAPAYSATRKAMALQLGLGRRPGRQADPSDKAASPPAKGRRQASGKAEKKAQADRSAQ